MVLIAARDKRDVVGKCFVFGSPTLGPGSYNVSTELSSNGAGLGKEKRPSPGNRQPGQGPIPGPGYYDICKAASEPDLTVLRVNPVRLGASAFRLKKARCTQDNWKEPLLVPLSSIWTPSTVAENPGPGAYNTPEGARILMKRPDTGSVWDERPKGKVHGLQMLAQSSPSIPAARDPNSLNLLGPEPGEYSLEALTIGHNARLVDFHASKLERKPPIQGFEANPGPGTYEHIVKPTTADSVPVGRLPAGTGGGRPAVPPPAFGNNVPQLSTAQPFVASSCSPSLTPGPGRYELDAGDSTMSSEGAGVSSSPLTSLAAMRSTTSRDGWWRPALTQPFTDPEFFKNLLGPGHYPSNSSFHGKHKRARSIWEGDRKKYLGVHAPHTMKSLEESDGAVLCGFSSSEPRMPPLRPKPMAEPGSYDRDQALGQSISAALREPAKVGKAGAFGRTKEGSRFPLDKECPAPDPGEYQDRVVESHEISRDVSGGAFRSSSPRVPRDLTVDHGQKPSPGDYDIPSSFDLLSRTSTSSFRKPKTEHLCFGRSGERFYTEEERAPPPGEYNPQKSQGNILGGVMSMEDRKLDMSALRKDTRLGLDPGNYNVGGTLIRKTFNISQAVAIEHLQTQSAVPKLPPPAGPFPWASKSSWKPRQVLEAEAAAKLEAAGTDSESHCFCTEGS